MSRNQRLIQEKRAGDGAGEDGREAQGDSAMNQQLDIPSGWLIKRLSYLIKSMDAGVSVNSEDRKANHGEYGILKTSAVTTGVFNANENKAILASEVKRAKILPTGDRIIMSRMNTPVLVGANAYVPQAISNLFLPDRLWLLTPKEDRVNMRWLAFVLGSPKYRSKLSSFATGTSNSMKNITKEDVASLLVLIPPLPEQKAIAALLSTWDQAIEKTERLIQAKENSLKAQIQRIMGKEAIDANGWPMAHLGKLFSEVTRKVGRKELTPFSISAGIGFVSQSEKWGKDISGAQYKNYTHLKAGEFSYNKGNSKRYQQGCVYLLKEGEICVPNVFISFKARANKDVVPEFFEYYFIADYHARELKRYITSGARSDGLLNLDKKDFFKIMVPFPSPGEQKNIAESLNASQHEIDLLKRLAEKYKTQKRGLMQKILTGQWRIRPEIVERYVEV